MGWGRVVPEFKKDLRLLDLFIFSFHHSFIHSFFHFQVEVEQKAVLYQSSHDWWFYKTVHEEVFDNHDNSSATWNFSEKINSESKAKWTLVKALKSSKVLPMNLKLEYPVAKYGQEPLKVEFDCTKLSPTYKSQEAKSTGQFNICEDITIEPYNSSKVCAQLKVGADQ